EAHVHPGRIRPHRNVLEGLELRELDDLVQVLVDVAPFEAVDGGVQIDVLDTGEVGVEARADLDQRADPPADLQHAGARSEDAGDQVQQRRLPGAVAPDDAEGLAGMDVDVDVSKRPQIAGPRNLSAQDRLLQRTALREPDLEDPAEATPADLAGGDRVLDA